MPRLGDFEATVNAAARDWLTHAITINGRTVYVQGHYGDGLMPSLGSTGIAQEIELMILKADWPSEPVKADVFVLPKKPGQRFYPVNVQTSEDGAHWIVEVKRRGS